MKEISTLTSVLDGHNDLLGLRPDMWHLNDNLQVHSFSIAGVHGSLHVWLLADRDVVDELRDLEIRDHDCLVRYRVHHGDCGVEDVLLEVRFVDVNFDD